MFREQLKVYPLAQASSPPPMQFVSGSKVPVNTIHANDATFFDEVAHGRFTNRDPDAQLYPEIGWRAAFLGGDHQWLPDRGARGRYLDARTAFFYMATVNTPAMVLKMVGKGSQYAVCYVSSDGAWLDGNKTYRMRIPANVPAKDFWSVVLYDPQTRSELQTAQPFPSKNSKRDRLVANDDGSIDLWFGPKAPAGHEANWVQTVAGKGWFTLLRLYGPLEPWFDKSWRPGEFVEVK